MNDTRDQEATESSARAEQELAELLREAGPRPEIPAADLEAIAGAARLAWRRQVRRRPPTRLAAFRPLALALAAALALAVGLAWWRAQSAPLPPTVAWVETVTGAVEVMADGEAAGGSALAPGAPIPLGAGLRSGGERPGRASLRLPGGVVLRLDSDTRLRLATAALVELERGAIYVDTGTGGGSGAIAVRTALGTARDVGTRFSARLADAELVVRVRDGAVETEAAGRSFVTPAGQELVLRRDGSAQSGPATMSGPEWEWVMEAAAGFAIEGRTLGEFLDWVARETGWRIRWADAATAAAAAETLHGDLGHQRPDRALYAVLPGAGLEGELNGDILVLRALRTPR